jgi:hypothetical protein
MVDKVALQHWLKQSRTELVAKIALGVRKHVASLRSRRIDFYGYALHPGESYDIGNIVGITNREADIPVSSTDERYQYYRLCVDEWQIWDHDQFGAANKLLVKLNKQFATMHSKNPSDYMMDRWELAHSRALLNALLQGLLTAKREGVFGDRKPFLAVWIQDPGDTMFKSVRILNSKTVYQEFKKEFDV